MPYNVAAIAQRGQGKLVHLDKPFTYEPLAWAVRKGDFDFVKKRAHPSIFLPIQRKIAPSFF